MLAALGSFIAVFAFLWLSGVYDVPLWLQVLVSLLAFVFMVALMMSLKRRRYAPLSHPDAVPETDAKPGRHFTRFRSLWQQNPIYTSAGIVIVLILVAATVLLLLGWLGAANTAFIGMILTIGLAGARLVWISR